MPSTKACVCCSMKAHQTFRVCCPGMNFCLDCIQDPETVNEEYSCPVCHRQLLGAYYHLLNSVADDDLTVYEESPYQRGPNHLGQNYHQQSSEHEQYKLGIRNSQLQKDSRVSDFRNSQMQMQRNSYYQEQQEQFQFENQNQRTRYRGFAEQHDYQNPSNSLQRLKNSMVGAQQMISEEHEGRHSFNQHKKKFQLKQKHPSAWCQNGQKQTPFKNPQFPPSKYDNLKNNYSHSGFNAGQANQPRHNPYPMFQAQNARHSDQLQIMQNQRRPNHQIHPNFDASCLQEEESDGEFQFINQNEGSMTPQRHRSKRNQQNVTSSSQAFFESKSNFQHNYGMQRSLSQHNFSSRQKQLNLQKRESFHNRSQAEHQNVVNDDGSFGKADEGKDYSPTFGGENSENPLQTQGQSLKQNGASNRSVDNSSQWNQSKLRRSNSELTLKSSCTEMEI